MPKSYFLRQHEARMNIQSGRGCDLHASRLRNTVRQYADSALGAAREGRFGFALRELVAGGAVHGELEVAAASCAVAGRMDGERAFQMVREATDLITSAADEIGKQMEGRR